MRTARSRRPAGVSEPIEVPAAAADLSAAPAPAAGAGRTASSVVSGPSRPSGEAPTFRPPSDKFESLLRRADVRVIRQGEDAWARPWDIRLLDERLSKRVRRAGTVGLGDAYVDGWWECDALDGLFERVLRADLPARLRWHPRVLAAFLGHVLVNQQTLRRARRNSELHYDLRDDVFESMLDPAMQYTCGYWKTAATLEQAQNDKLDLICRKLALRPGMTLLDLGCGWGGLARFAAQRYGAHVTGVTLSKDQLRWAQQRGAAAPAAGGGGSVEYLLTDYRSATGQFDRVTMIGMLEHVGQRNHVTAMRVIRDRLKPDGLALVQTIAVRDSFPNRTHSEVAWLNKHIFSGGVLPSLKQIGRAIDGLLVIEDLHNFSAHYDPTLMAWAANFERSWPALRGKYGDRFFRMWRYYLLSCAGGFRARDYQLWQMVLSRDGVSEGYESVR